MQKNFGLDIVRSVAIFLVLIAHLSPFFKNNPIIFNLLYHSGLYGVEIFFVLSGFLIGQTILVKIASSFSFKQIKTFYLRRFLRIIPLYYFILISLIFVDNYVLKSRSFHLYHFVFLQNFFPNETAFFAVSWTLSIQFWFYIVIPIIFLILNYKKYSTTKLMKTFIYIIFTIILFRSVYVYVLNPTFDFGVRKNILMRFDSLLIGVLFAILKQKFNFFYKKITNKYFSVIALASLIIFYA